MLAVEGRLHIRVRLRVLRVHPAWRFYERHGFVTVDADDPHGTVIRPA